MFSSDIRLCPTDMRIQCLWVIIRYVYFMLYTVFFNENIWFIAETRIELLFRNLKCRSENQELSARPDTPDCRVPGSRGMAGSNEWFGCCAGASGAELHATTLLLLQRPGTSRRLPRHRATSTFFGHTPHVVCTPNNVLGRGSGKNGPVTD